MSFDWNRARAFLVTAEEGSYSAAARALGQAQPTLGRQVTALEEELGVPLFERVGHRLQLTPAGMDLLEHVRAMGEAATRISLTAAGQALSLEGPVCITAGEIIAARLLPPIITRLRQRHPGIQVEVVASNTPADLRRREADLALRNFRPSQPDLIARKLSDGAARLYATEAYLDRIGRPQTPEALSRADFIAFDNVEVLIDGLNKLGLSLDRGSFPVRSESQLVQWELARAGAGIAIMLEEIGDHEPGMRRALPALPPFPVPMWLVSHRELATSKRMRVVADELARALGEPGRSPGAASD